MNGEKFMHSMPCQRVNTSGYFLGSVLNLTVPVTCRSTLDSRVIAPVRKLPAGSTTWPPPPPPDALMALAHAAGLVDVTAPLAPPSVTLHGASPLGGGRYPLGL